MTKENLLIQETHFAFGKNWLDYAKKIDADRVKRATDDLQRLSGSTSLNGKSFLDIGCGSGLHALAALRLGATRIVGTDIDPDSVAASKQTLARFAPDAACDVQKRSIFNMTSDDTLGQFDVVYSWGVLHHTGNMRRAIEIASTFVTPDGVFYIALYKKTLFCGMWRMIKKWYSRATQDQQHNARIFYISVRKFIMMLGGKNFDLYVEQYGRRRGMTFENDVHDWLGGYPYESISPKACHALFTSLGFELQREFISSQWRSVFGLFGSGCDEYVFKRIT